MDDILVYSPTLDDHKTHPQAVFQLLQDNNLFLKWSKCSFAQIKFEYLDRIISDKGVATHPSKIQAVQNWETP
jgi:hypothetical protein